MRFILLLFLIAAPFAHAQAPAATPPVTEKPDAPHAWRSLSLEARREILSAWKALPEATRPPFPVFRDDQIEKMLAPTAQQPSKTN